VREFVLPTGSGAVTVGAVNHRRLLTWIVALVAAAVVLDGCADAHDFGRSGARARPTVVVEHGAFTDASGWDAVVGRLRRRGYDVLAPANPLRGVAPDAAYLRSVLKTIEGPIVLVGHSYGGAVITNAAVGVPRVKALVYIAAVAPKEGESQMDIFARFPGSLLGPSTIIERKFPGGVDQYVKVESFRDVFSADLPAGKVATAAATQRPLAKVAGSAKSGPPAWRTIPTWFMVATEDHAIPPAAERFMAKRARAHTVEVKSSHTVMLSHPGAVTKLILAAARHAGG
jgi:pimeloyl-ACP methyl ester carboxylesterase